MRLFAHHDSQRFALAVALTLSMPLVSSSCSIVIDESEFQSSRTSGMDAGPTGCPTAIQCEGAQPVCDEGSGVCVACTDEDPAFCEGQDQVCFEQACVDCVEASDCDENMFCQENACVQCRSETDCSMASPHCNDVGTCVECLESDHCTDDVESLCGDGRCVECRSEADCGGPTPACDPTTGRCVQCIDDGYCQSPDAAKCGPAQSCVPCDDSSQCSGIQAEGRLLGVCEAGDCVTCTAATEEATCGTKSCNPATNQCTDVDRGSVSHCMTCNADSECDNGVCMAISFIGAVASQVCMPLPPDCEPPYYVEEEGTSVNGTAATYCRLDNEDISCYMVLTLNAERSCADDGDVSCGPGMHCRHIGSGLGRICTYPCDASHDCPPLAPVCSTVCSE